MAIQSRTTLKSWFETGDKPTQLQYHELIESLLHVNEDRAILGLRAHDPARIYKVNEAALKDGKLYIAIIENQGAFDPNKWIEGLNTQSYAGFPEYVNATTYTLGNQVTYQFRLFKLDVASSQGVPPLNIDGTVHANWVEISASSGEFGEIWQAGVYKNKDVVRRNDLLYELQEADGFVSEDIDLEITEGKWKQLTFKVQDLAFGVAWDNVINSTASLNVLYDAFIAHVPRDGSRPMLDNLDMGNNNIVNLTEIFYGGVALLDFSTYRVRDSSNVVSISWNGRSLHDSTGTNVFSWNTGLVAGANLNMSSYSVTSVSTVVLNNAGTVTNAPANAGLGLLDDGTLLLYGASGSLSFTGGLVMEGQTSFDIFGPNGGLSYIAAKSSWVHSTLLEAIASTINISGDVVNIGKPGGVTNILGGVINYEGTESYIEDKRITLNRLGSAASGVSSGIEIEEDSVITGYFYTNATRDGWELKAPGIAYKTTLSLSNLTGDVVGTMPNKSITFAGINNESFTGTTVFENVTFGTGWNYDHTYGVLYQTGTAGGVISGGVTKIATTRISNITTASVFIDLGSSNLTLQGVSNILANVRLRPSSHNVTDLGSATQNWKDFYTAKTYILDFDAVTSKLALSAGSSTGVLTLGTDFSTVNIPATTTATNTVSGALTVAGGVGILGALYVGGNLQQVTAIVHSGNISPSTSNTRAIGTASLMYSQINVRQVLGETKSGTNVAGNNLTIASSIGTGNSGVTSIVFQTPTVEASGSTVQTLSERLRINSSEVLATVTAKFPTYKVLDFDGITYKTAFDSPVVGELRVGNEFDRVSIKGDYVDKGKRLTADVTTTLATAQPISDLNIPLEANSTYVVECDLMVGCSTTNGIRIRVQGPTGATAKGYYHASWSGSLSQVNSSFTSIPVTLSAVHTQANDSGFIRISFVIVTSATAGNLEVLFHAQTAGDTAKVLENSWIKVKKI